MSEISQNPSFSFSEVPQIMANITTTTTTTSTTPTKPTKQIKKTPKRGKPAATKRAPPPPVRSQAAPLKVVYISNPMRVQASASDFRAKVQELTGRDAYWPDNNYDNHDNHCNSQSRSRSRSRCSDHRVLTTEPDLEEEEEANHHHHHHQEEVSSLAHQPILSCFGSSDLDCFGPFNGGDEQMVIMEDFSSFYG